MWFPVRRVVEFFFCSACAVRHGKQVKKKEIKGSREQYEERKKLTKKAGLHVVCAAAQ